MSVWIDRFDVGRFGHGDVMRDDELAIFRQHDVLLDEVGTLSMRQDLGPLGMLDEVPACAAMCDDDRLRSSEGTGCIRLGS